MATRGGTAKASSVINVSEDIFAGYTAALRGGESRHAEFLQCGKGRDVGVLQVRAPHCQSGRVNERAACISSLWQEL